MQVVASRSALSQHQCKQLSSIPMGGGGDVLPVFAASSNAASALLIAAPQSNSFTRCCRCCLCATIFL